MFPNSAEIIEPLSAEAKLILDFERGTTPSQSIGEVAIAEYALGYVGPSERFANSYIAAGVAGLAITSTFQLNTTHELAPVPNLPLIRNRFEKLR